MWNSIIEKAFTQSALTDEETKIVHEFHTTSPVRSDVVIIQSRHMWCYGITKEMYHGGFSGGLCMLVETRATGLPTGLPLSMVIPRDRFQRYLHPNAIQFDRKRMPTDSKENVIYDKENVIYDYVDKVLSTSDFQNDPVSYMEAWRKRRGNTEELRIPEDPARTIITALISGKDIYTN